MKHEVLPEVVVNLLGGRARIERGWCKGRMKSEDGARYCALGAIEAASYDGLAAIWLMRALPKGEYYVSTYNDSLRTNKADILALFDRAIELALNDRAIALAMEEA